MSTPLTTPDKTLTLIDTHCHIEMDPFESDRESVLQRAEEQGIEAIISIGSDWESNLRNMALSKEYNLVFISVGIHPHDAKDCTDEILGQIRGWVKDFGMVQRSRNNIPKIVAIGETGLDYHYDHSPRDVQKAVFMKHLELARETDLPVIVHSRESQHDTLSVLSESGVYKGVLHCFSGDMEMAERAMEMGFYISLAGPVTFRNATRLTEVARMIPDDYLLIETDAPYLTPEPLRGKRNEPAYLIHTARKLADIRGVTVEDIARITALNAKRLFSIGELPTRGEITYKIRDTLYLNITNRCTNKCSFCARFHTDYVKGHNLRLMVEPSEEELKEAIGNPSQYREVVFCGYGEPLLRLPLVRSLARWVKEQGGSVRINTNGHGNIIHKRNILPDLQGIVDSLSVSLDAHDAETYNRICTPLFTNAFQEVIAFIREAKKYIPSVQATVVEMDGVDIEKCRKLADDLSVTLKVRKLNIVG